MAEIKSAKATDLDPFTCRSLANTLQNTDETQLKMLVSDTQLKITRQFTQNIKENTLQYVLLYKVCPKHKHYLNSYIVMKDAD